MLTSRYRNEQVDNKDLRLFISTQTDFATGILSYVRAVINIKMTDDEAALFTACLLVSPERTGLNDRERVEILLSSVKDAFVNMVSKKILN